MDKTHSLVLKILHIRGNNNNNTGPRRPAIGGPCGQDGPCGRLRFPNRSSVCHQQQTPPQPPGNAPAPAVSRGPAKPTPGPAVPAPRLAVPASGPATPARLMPVLAVPSPGGSRALAEARSAHVRDGRVLAGVEAGRSGSDRAERWCWCRAPSAGAGAHRVLAPRAWLGAAGPACLVGEGPGRLHRG
jgi:hypothetical protein